MNKIFISGNLTRNPEVKSTQSGKTYARMGIAVNRAFSKAFDDIINAVSTLADEVETLIEEKEKKNVQS